MAGIAGVAIQIALTGVIFAMIVPSPDPELKTENLVLITFDGLRTQEMFAGLDLPLLEKGLEGKAPEESPIYQQFWAETAEERRELLMPFFWKTLMRDRGSIAGNQDLGSTVLLKNGHRFSFPGYSEILTGQARDAEITSNDRVRNPHPTVLEFLQERLSLDQNQVAVFACWDVFNWIAESKEGSFTVNAGFEAYEGSDEETKRLSDLQFETPTPWDSVRHDVYTYRFAMDHLKTHQPSVFYLALGETDDWAHDDRYDRVLQAIHRSDAYLAELFEYLDSDEKYAGRTTVLLTTDHGRGNLPSDWMRHGADVEGAQNVWLACVSPDSPLRGEWKSETLYLDQVASSMCSFLGLDYLEQDPDAGPPIDFGQAP